MQINGVYEHLPAYVSGKLLTNDGTSLSWTDNLSWDETTGLAVDGANGVTLLSVGTRNSADEIVGFAHNWPGITFNAYYDTDWRFSKTTSAWAGLFSIRADVNNWFFAGSTAAGTSGNAITWQVPLAVDLQNLTVGIGKDQGFGPLSHTANLQVDMSAAALTGFQIKGIAAQSANYVDIDDSDGGAILDIDSSGKLTITGTTGPQLTLTDNGGNTTLRTDSSGDLTVTPSGGDLFFAGDVITTRSVVGDHFVKLINTAAAGSGSNSIISKHRTSEYAGGKIVFNRDGIYTEGNPATYFSSMSFYTTNNGTDTVALQLHSDQTANFGANVVATSGQGQFGNINIGGSTGVNLSASSSALTIAGLSVNKQENLIFDFDETGNDVDVSSSTGVVAVDFGSLNLLGADITASGKIQVGPVTATVPLHLSASGSNCDLIAEEYQNNAYGVMWQTRKARGTSSIPVVLNSGDEIGKFYFYGYNAGWKNAAYIAAVVEGTPAGTNMPTKLQFYTASASATPALRFEIREDGVSRFLGKLAFTQSDENEYIDSLADGYMDYRATTAHRFGDGTNQLSIAADGELTLTGTATVWNDMQFQISDAKVTPASLLPSWEAFTANTSEYAFSVNDEVDTSANEIPHSWKQDTAGNAHIHITTKAINDTETTYAKFTVTFAYADTNEVWAETPLTAELTIANPTAALTNFYLDLGDITLTNYLIGAQMRCRVKRIAATTGTEYVGDIFITQIGVHFEEDTIGSRTEIVK